MELIKYFLERYTNITPPDAIVRREISNAIKNVIQIDVLIRDIKISRGIAFLKISPAVKNKIFIKKKELLQVIWQSVGKNLPIDIR
jgi:hypothetical protein